MAEQLTEELAEKAWSLFQDIERDGGMAAVLVSGSLAKRIAETEAARAARIATRKDALTGVSEFPNIAEDPAKVDSPDIEGAVKQADARAAQATGAINDLPGHGKGSLMAALVKAAGEDASAPAIGTALKGEPIQIESLPQHRLAEDFEALRNASDTELANTGKRPQIFLANIGKIAEFTARASFAKNVFEAGGLETLSGDGGEDAQGIAKAFKDSGAASAVICSTDDLYAAHAETLAKALVEAGAKAVYLAGKGGDHEAAWRAAGVNDFIFLGCDVVTILRDAHERLGVKQVGVGQ